MLSLRVWIFFTASSVLSLSYHGYNVYQQNKYNASAILKINDLTHELDQSSHIINKKLGRIKDMYYLKNKSEYASFLNFPDREIFFSDFTKITEDSIEKLGSPLNEKEYITLHNDAVTCKYKSVSEYYKSKMYNRIVDLKMSMGRISGCGWSHYHASIALNDSLYFYSNFYPEALGHLELKFNEHEIESYYQDSIIIPKDDTINWQLKYTRLEGDNLELKETIKKGMYIMP